MVGVRLIKSLHELLRLKTPFHIRVGGFDELRKSAGIDVTIGSQLHVTHVLASAFEQASRIGKLSAAKEANVDVSIEDANVGECRILDTGGGIAIVQQLVNVVSTVAHDLKPAPGDCSQLAGAPVKPGINSRIPPDGTSESEELAHGDQVTMPHQQRADRFSE
jgi:hypothetical protein